MSFTVNGSPTPRHDMPQNVRPASAKPTTVRNPITGEEAPLRVPSHRDNLPLRLSQKPEGIPGLDLKYLQDADNYVYKPIEISNYPLHSAAESTRTDVSWGTAASTARSTRQPSARSPRTAMPQGMPPLSFQDVDDMQHATVSQKPTTPRPQLSSSWDVPPVPDSCPLPSDNHKQIYKQYEDEMKKAFRNTGKANFTEEEIEKVIEEVKERHPALDISKDDIVGKSWTKRQNHAAEQYLKKMDAEELLEHNKKLKLVETVMTDQLSRAVISDPEQNMHSQMSEARRPHGSIRSLHDSKVRTAASATENLLSKRVRFGVRIVTRNGHDAIRELTGFFFSVDNTLTIYEFRQFGKSAKALPFVSRGRFCHVRGPRAGEPYILVDVCPGYDLTISTAGLHTLPESLKTVPEVTFKVTDVCEEEKRELLLNGIPNNQKEDVYTRLHIPNKQEYTEKMVLKSIQKNVQRKIIKRAIRTITGLGRYYRKCDTGTGVLYRYELEKGLFDFHIDLPPDTLDALFEILDTDEKGALDYSVYMWAVLGNMIEARKSIVRKAFQKIDSSKKGYLTISDIEKFFNSTFRPNRDVHDSREVGPLQAFLDAVLANKKQEQVSYVEFEEYYEGLSLAVDDDEDFYNIVRNTWTL